MAMGVVVRWEEEDWWREEVKDHEQEVSGGSSPQLAIPAHCL